MIAPTGRSFLPTAGREGGFSPGRTLGPVVGTDGDGESGADALVGADETDVDDDGTVDDACGVPDPLVHAASASAAATKPAKGADCRKIIIEYCHGKRSCARLSTGTRCCPRSCAPQAGRHAVRSLQAVHRRIVSGRRQRKCPPSRSTMRLTINSAFMERMNSRRLCAVAALPLAAALAACTSSSTTAGQVSASD